MPDQVTAALNIKSNEVITAIESGEAYFGRRFARQAGQVYVVDANANLLTAAKREIPDNLYTVLTGDDDSRKPDVPTDTLFFCNVLRSFTNLPVYLATAFDSLKSNGRVVIIDFRVQPPPPKGVGTLPITEGLVVAAMRAIGFRQTASYTFLPTQFFLVFQR